MEKNLTFLAKISIDTEKIIDEANYCSEKYNEDFEDCLYEAIFDYCNENYPQCDFDENDINKIYNDIITFLKKHKML